MSSGQRRSKRKHGRRKSVGESRVQLGKVVTKKEAEEDPDAERLVANRRNRREQGQRSVLAPTLGPATTPTVKDLLRMGKKRKGKARTPEHVAEWTANSEARRRLSTQSITVLETDLGKQVHLLKADYPTALDVAKEWNYSRLSGIKGIGPAFLTKLHTYLTNVGFQVNWRP